jgi:MFS family permease
MTENRVSRIQREVRSPRSAAFAGIAYSILMITGMILTASIAKVGLEDITLEVLDSWSRKASLIILLVPFAGIAFLWFTGVIRDRLGELEDRFFATIFYGSGIIQVVLLFLWGAIFGAVMVARTLTAVGLIDSGIYIFSFALMNEIIGNYALRMAGVYMTAINALWSKTGLMPRWLTIITYVLAMGFLVAAERIREARFIFPVWVFVVSIYILVLNYRRTHELDDQPKVSGGG